MRRACVSVLAASLLCGQIAYAENRSEILERAAKCDVLTNERAWLDCYYAAAQPKRAELGLPPAPQAPAYEALFDARTTPPPAEAERRGLLGFLSSPKVPASQFGLSDAKPGRGENVDRIVERFSDYVFRHDGQFVVTLANGQQWSQVGGDKAHWRKPPPSYTAIITHGALNTYNMRIREGSSTYNTLYQVVRIN